MRFQFLLLLQSFNKCSFESVGVLSLERLLDVGGDAGFTDHFYFFAWKKNVVVMMMSKLPKAGLNFIDLKVDATS